MTEPILKNRLRKPNFGIVSFSLKIVGDRFTLLGSLGFSLSEMKS